MSEQFENFKDIINRTVENISNNDINNANSICKIWKDVLSTIKNDFNENEGKNLSSHTQVVDFKGGILFVEADHPGWIELLKIYKKYILVGLNRKSKEIKIESLAISLKKKKKNPYEIKTEEIIRQKKEYLLKLEKEQENIEKKLNFSEIKSKKSDKKIEIPEELKNVLDTLKQDMLTNKENK